MFEIELLKIIKRGENEQKERRQFSEFVTSTGQKWARKKNNLK